jgi:hypothetical protein
MWTYICACVGRTKAWELQENNALIVAGASYRNTLSNVCQNGVKIWEPCSTKFRRRWRSLIILRPCDILQGQWKCTYPEDGGSIFLRNMVNFYQKTVLFTVTAVRTSILTKTSYLKRGPWGLHYGNPVNRVMTSDLLRLLMTCKRCCWAKSAKALLWNSNPTPGQVKERGIIFKLHHTVVCRRNAQRALYLSPGSH